MFTTAAYEVPFFADHSCARKEAGSWRGVILVALLLSGAGQSAQQVAVPPEAA